MDRASLERKLKDLPLGLVRYFERIESTNVEAAHWADEGAPDLSLVVANEQTAGKGRSGRTWFTPPDAALAFSLLLRGLDEPDHTAALESTLFPTAYETEVSGRPEPQGGRDMDVQLRLARLTALGALAVCQALQKLYGLEAQIKWPNDVLLERRKACGILTEAHWQGEWLAAAILGIGINVTPAAVPPDNQVIFPATSIESVLKKDVDRLELLHAVLEALVFWRGPADSWKTDKQLPQPNPFLTAWDERLAFKGETVQVYNGVDVRGRPDDEGELLGLDEHGCLRLRRQDGELRSICTGEVRLRPTQ